MNRTVTTQENGGIKSSFPQHQENIGYTYEGTYAMYSSGTSTPSSANQPLPGQPPLPPMPPPPGALPPLPHVFGPVASQVASIQTWAHPPPPPWQWITPQATALQSQTQRELSNNAYQRDAVARNNYARRDRFNQNRNNVYSPRNALHRSKNRRPQQRYEQQQASGQFESAAYFGQALTSGIGIDWQRTNMAAAQNEALMNHMTASMPGHQMTTSRISAARTDDEITDQGVKIISEVSLKKTKQRKPMSQNYPSRPWNRVDAENALQIENEYKSIRAQSLIIKFPDPDLNKDIVREFHPGIQNIHFQSPSGPRYCFIQMAEDINIDKAIRELEKIPFGVGNLKVERKSLRDEDNPMPEEIDPYTLYVGNLPESVNVNEVKNKFPTAARVDVGYAQKMRNTRYAFIRYTNVEESIAAYKQARDLMWDTRSIIVRFRRHRGNTCLPGEPKSNCKKVKEEPNSEQVKNERANGAKGQQISRSTVNNEENEKSQSAEEPLEIQTILPTECESPSTQTKQNWRPPTSEDPAVAEAPAISRTETTPETIMIADIKEEPEDYDDMEMSYMEEEDDDDDDDDDNDDDDEDNLMREEEDDGENDTVEDDDDEEEDMMNEESLAQRKEKELTDSEPADELDTIFGELENAIPRDIEL